MNVNGTIKCRVWLMPICRLATINIYMTMDFVVLKCKLSMHNSSYNHLNLFRKMNYLVLQKICQTHNLVGVEKLSL